MPGLTRGNVEAADLVRTWTVRGTIHLLPADDMPWMHAAVGPRYQGWMERTLERRGALDIARGMLPDLLELIAERARDRAEILRERLDLLPVRLLEHLDQLLALGVHLVCS